MQKRFIKYDKKKVVNIDTIAWVGDLGNGIYFLQIGEGEDVNNIVSPEYEDEWRLRFDLNDE
jgi:hypothetical protein